MCWRSSHVIGQWAVTSLEVSMGRQSWLLCAWLAVTYKHWHSDKAWTCRSQWRWWCWWWWWFGWTAAVIAACCRLLRLVPVILEPNLDLQHIQPLRRRSYSTQCWINAKPLSEASPVILYSWHSSVDLYIKRRYLYCIDHVIYIGKIEKLTDRILHRSSFSMIIKGHTYIDRQSYTYVL